MSGSTSTWPSQAGPAPMPMVGIVSDFVIWDARGAGMSSSTMGQADGAAPYDLRVVDHLLERGGERGLRPGEHLIHRVSDEQDVHPRRVEQAREQGVVAGERDDALAALLHGDELVGRDRLRLVSHRGSAPPARAAKRGGWEPRGAE